MGPPKSAKHRTKRQTAPAMRPAPAIGRSEKGSIAGAVFLFYHVLAEK